MLPEVGDGVEVEVEGLADEKALPRDVFVPRRQQP
jgi:hypothetical protein